MAAARNLHAYRTNELGPQALAGSRIRQLRRSISRAPQPSEPRIDLSLQLSMAQIIPTRYGTKRKLQRWCGARRADAPRLLPPRHGSARIPRTQSLPVACGFRAPRFRGTGVPELFVARQSG